jgi:hypothetical protein
VSVNPIEVVDRARDLARVTAEQARSLSQEEHDRLVVEAERRARREAEVDGRLSQHEARLNLINGSISRSASALEHLSSSFREFVKRQDKRDVEYDTRETDHWKEKGQAFSRKQIYLGFATVLAMSLVPLILAVFH